MTCFGKVSVLAAVLASWTVGASESFSTPDALQSAVRTVGPKHDAAVEAIKDSVRVKLRWLADAKWNVGNPACRLAAGASPDEGQVAELVDAIVKTDVQFYSPAPKDYTSDMIVGEATQRVCQATMVMN